MLCTESLLCTSTLWLEWCFLSRPTTQLSISCSSMPHCCAITFQKSKTVILYTLSLLFTSLSMFKSWLISQSSDVYRVTQYCFVFLHSYNNRLPPPNPLSCLCVQKHVQRVRRPCGRGWSWPWLSACSLRAGGRRVAQGAAAASRRRSGRLESWIPWRSQRAKWRWWRSFRPADPSAWCRRPSR